MKELKKVIISILISWIPINCVRIILYRISGYKIGKKVKIGFRTILIANYCLIADNVHIGRKTYIKVKKLEIGAKTRIGNNNKLLAWANYSNNLLNSNYIKIGEECLITEGHLLDGTIGLEIGDKTWLAGRNSSLWSHGSTRKPMPIIIGKRCYIGSDVKIGTDVVIGDEVLVAMGSVVVRGCPSRCTIAGLPAIVKRENYLWYEHWQ